jgi:hypothetical protein
MGAMAHRIGLLRWPDNQAPRDLSLHGTIFASWSRLENCHEGILNGRQVAVFDLVWRSGKSAWSRTILAVRLKGDFSSRKPYHLANTVVGEWTIFYAPKELLNSKKLIDAAEVEELLLDVVR